ncbi:hypothetical protein [Mycobacterium colombiense]|uniref:hypothetical protein n=1 Tax=Mycobacterium colombiense TaxID=339268 RepID=UPI0012DB5DD4|nr:hypothetical protein [Mycobacterium colombiense]
MCVRKARDNYPSAPGARGRASIHIAAKRERRFTPQSSPFRVVDKTTSGGAPPDVVGVPNPFTGRNQVCENPAVWWSVPFLSTQIHKFGLFGNGSDPVIGVGVEPESGGDQQKMSFQETASS